MDISVIVLTYNQETTIGRALDSILAQQTTAEFEIIIGDDCSTDKTGEICKAYEKLYPDKIRYIKRKKNIGLVNNYYDCFDKSEGKYIADCSGDDYWVDTQKLQNQFIYLKEHKDVTLVSGEWLTEDTSQKALFIAPNAMTPGTYNCSEVQTDVFVNHKVVNLSSSLYRKETIENYKRCYPDIINSTESIFEDLQIIMVCLCTGKIAVLPGVVLHYTIGHESVSNKNSCEKRFFYTYRALQQKQKLEHHFIREKTDQDKKKLKQYYRETGNYLMAMAFKSGPSYNNLILRRELNKLQKGIKGHIYNLLMFNNYIWTISLRMLNKIKHDTLA